MHHRFTETLESRRLFASVPAGFGLSTLTTGLSEPTAMAELPDGRLLVAEQGGNLRLLKNNTLENEPVLSLVADNSGERGLLGVAVDPGFASNGYVYLYYTSVSPRTHNRLSRFTMTGDRGSLNSEKVLLDLPNLSDATNHNGGAIHFAPDGTLYVGVGENGNGSNSPLLSTTFGKILRINSDGSIPTDNPFFSQATGINRAIYARGLRNPFTFAFSPTGTLLINDVGQSTTEEINVGQPGANYGWPATEGPTNAAGITGPAYSYDHSVGQAIAGAAFDAAGKYYFADYVAGFINTLDLTTGTASPFATGFDQPVDLMTAKDGSLLVLTRSPALYRISPATGLAPVINAQPVAKTARVGQTATFVVAVSGDALLYQWQLNGRDIPGATFASFTAGPIKAADNGASYRCVISNPGGSVTSNAVKLTVDTNRPPVAVIVSPAVKSTYAAGQKISLSFSATDPDQKTLADSAFSYTVVFHHGTHTHPFIPATRGKRSATITIPSTGESATNVFYRIALTVRDSKGAETTVTRDIKPRLSRIKLQTDAPVSGLSLNGVPVARNLNVAVVEGFKNRFEAPLSFSAGGFKYTFNRFNTGVSVKRGVITLVTPPGTTTVVVSYNRAKL